MLEILAWGQDARGKDVLGLEIVPSDACDWQSGSKGADRVVRPKSEAYFLGNPHG